MRGVLCRGFIVRVLDSKCVVLLLVIMGVLIPRYSEAAVAPANIPAFVYEGAGCTGAAALPKYQAMLGRAVDGASDFLDDSSTWSNLVVSTQWAAGCWRGKVANLALGLPMGRG